MTQLVIHPRHHTIIRLPGRVSMSPVQLCLYATRPVEFWTTTESSYQKWLVGAGPLEAWDRPAKSQVHEYTLDVPSGVPWLLVINNPSSQTSLTANYSVSF